MVMFVTPAPGAKPKAKPARKPAVKQPAAGPKFKRGECYMPPTAGMRFRDAWERLETRAANGAEEAARQRRAAIAVKPQRTVALMADDANEKVRRVRVMDAVERAFRDNHITDMDYRLARCVERDVHRTLQSGGGRFVLYADASAAEGSAYALMPRSPSAGARALASHTNAIDALARCEAAIGPGPAYAVLRAWAGEGFSLYELDKRWRKRRGWALGQVQGALAAMAAAQIYEREKWSIDVLAQAAA